MQVAQRGRCVRSAPSDFDKEERAKKEVSCQRIAQLWHCRWSPHPKGIGQYLHCKSRGKLQAGKDDFLLPEEEEEERFRMMLERHGTKGFAFLSTRNRMCRPEDDWADGDFFMVPHVPWNLKPIPIPRAHIPKLIELLKEKVRMGILEPSNSPYSNRWFTMPKKNGPLCFIQDLQPVNKGDDPKCWNWSKRGWICRSLHGKIDLFHLWSLFGLWLVSIGRR